MLIRMINAAFGPNGTLYSAGQQYDLANSFALELIGRGSAVQVNNSADALQGTGTAGSKPPGVPGDGIVQLDTSGPAAAAANSAAIQAALSTGGHVRLAGAGVAYYGAMHVIASDTHLEIVSGLTLRAADGSNCSFLRSRMFTVAPTVVTLAWTSGRACVVNWPDHGRSAGDPIWLRGSGPSQFRGVFLAESVTADTITIALRRNTATGPTGTIYAVPADNNVTLTVNGLIDGNWTANQGSTDVDRLVTVLGGNNVHVRKYVAQDGFKYLLALGAVRNFSVRDFTSIRSHSDGIKVYGPAFDGEITGVRGTMQDDALSLQPKEAVGFIGYDFTVGGGDILGVRCADVRPQKTEASAFIIYASDTEVIDECGLDGGSSSALAQIPFRLHGGYANSLVGHVWFRGLERQELGYPVWKTTGSAFVAERVDVSAASHAAGLASNSAIETGSQITCKQLNVELSLAGAAGGNTMNFTGAIDQINVKANVTNTGGAGRAVVITGGVKAVNLAGSSISGGECAVFATSGLSAAPSINVSDSRIDCGAGIRLEKAGAALSMRGVTAIGMSSGLVRVGGGVSAAVVDGGGNIVPAGNYLRRVAGTESVSVSGIGASVDVTQIARTPGSVVANTNAAAGTLGAAGQVVCDAAGVWHLMADPTKTY